jgi:hypothetical protein
MRVVDAVKRTWHDDLVAHPDTHAWVLSLYRAGELHPQTVDDYFPAWAADDPALRAKIEDHAKDEAKHVKLYDAAIAKLGRERIDFEGLDVFNVAIRTETGVALRISEVGEDGPTPEARRERLAHFLAHAHFLEKRIVRSVAYHVDACARAGRTDVARVVERIGADEERHVAYTLEAVRDLLPRARLGDVLEVHRRGEARANLSFSARQVRSFLERFSPHVGVRHALLYRASASMMEVAHAAL